MQKVIMFNGLRLRKVQPVLIDIVASVCVNHELMKVTILLNSVNRYSIHSLNITRRSFFSMNLGGGEEM